MAGVSVAASVLTIMALSVERYLAIRHPVTLRGVLTAGRLRTVIAVIWMLSLSVMLPLTVVRSVDHYQLLAVGQIITVCHEHWTSMLSNYFSTTRRFLLSTANCRNDRKRYKHTLHV